MVKVDRNNDYGYYYRQAHLDYSYYYRQAYLELKYSRNSLASLSSALKESIWMRAELRWSTQMITINKNNLIQGTMCALMSVTPGFTARGHSISNCSVDILCLYSLIFFKCLTNCTCLKFSRDCLSDPLLALECVKSCLA